LRSRISLIGVVQISGSISVIPQKYLISGIAKSSNVYLIEHNFTKTQVLGMCDEQNL
jgi:hypothetical protein